MIGILGGMGPKSTGPFIDQVVGSFQSLMGAKEDMDFPPMMIYSLPTPFYVDKPIDHKLMAKTICEGFKKLESCGVSFIAMPCNTAHVYFSELQSCIRVPLLHIVSVTLSQIPKSAKRVTILGTRSTLESQIYQKGLANLHYVFNPDWQKTIDAMLLHIKTESHLESARDLWEVLAQELYKAQIDTVIIACTDLSTVVKQASCSFHIIDSSLCLAEAIVKTWKELLL